MGKINWGRVIVGGLLAGVVLNAFDYVYYGVVMKSDMAAAMQALGKQPQAIDALVPWFIFLDFIYGIGLLWVYAAIRPRFGAGPKTGVIAGVAVWFFIALLHNPPGPQGAGSLTTRPSRRCAYGHARGGVPAARTSS